MGSEDLAETEKVANAPALAISPFLPKLHFQFPFPSLLSLSLSLRHFVGARKRTLRIYTRTTSQASDMKVQELHRTVEACLELKGKEGRAHHQVKHSEEGKSILPRFKAMHMPALPSREAVRCYR